MDSQRRDLRRAIKKNDAESVRAILSGSFFKQSCSVDALKPLLYAVKNDRSEIVELLLDYFELVEFEASCMENFLYIAVSSGNLRLAELFLRNGARITDDEWKRDSLVDHVFRRTNLDTRKDMLLLLLDYGLDVEFQDDLGQNVLHQFIDFYVNEDDRDAVRITEVLLERGVPLDEVDDQGLSLLHLAVYSENVELILYLIHKGARVSPSESRFSPLFAAAECCNEGIMDLLVSHGANINEKSKLHGRTALHEACLTLHNERIISLLVRKGADIGAVTADDGKTPLALLDPGKDSYLAFAHVLIKELSRLRFENLEVNKSDLALVQSDPRLGGIFRRCTYELEKMKRARFHPPYSVYSVMKMSRSIKKLAHLTKNQRFVRRFEDNFRRFSSYRSDLKRIFDEAVRVRDRLIIVDDRLNFIFGNALPAVVLRNLAENLTVEDLKLD